MDRRLAPSKHVEVSKGSFRKLSKLHTRSLELVVSALAMVTV